MTLIIFLLILSVLVLVHEFGHFIVAKRNGIRVEEFGLGLPPRLIGKQIGETIYSFNLLPFGGFVKLTGEDPEETEDNPALNKDPRSFSSKTPWQRAAVLVAGVAMNSLLAIVIFYIVLAFSSFKTSYIPMFFDYTFRFGKVETLDSVISDIQPGSGAEKSGIQSGEAILDIDGASVKNVSDIRNVLQGKEGKTVQVRLLDLKTEGDTSIRTVSAIPEKDAQGSAVLGVYLSKSVRINYSQFPLNVLSGVLHAYNVTAYSISAFAHVIGLSYTNRTIAPVSETVAGPVGIYNIVGSVIKYGGSRVVLNLLDFIGLMSVSLAFINILPVPALDGGRLFFVLFEGITKKRINPEVELRLHKIGFALLLGLILLITIKDIAAKFM
jgi:regulator of sigma E protease